MNKNKLNLYLIAIVAIVAIAGVAIYAISQNNDNKMMDGGMMNRTNSQLQGSDDVNKNSSEYKTYSQLKGDDYDRMFIANMIAHHQGAVDMAKVALANAKHQEIKDMADAIISAQTKEINDMKKWQSDWDYPASSGEMMEDHSAMGMMHDMSSMTADLKGLSGNEFDKAFLSSMIEHHQSAIDMAYSGQANAQHQEVKDLTKAIVSAQSREIAQMQQWQKDWGYIQ